MVRYELKRRVGAGTQGVVFLAERVTRGGTRQEVALKVLPPALGDAAEARLQESAVALARLIHPGVVAFIDLEPFADRWGVVMEYVPGADLKRLLVASPGPVPVRAATELVAEAAAAVHAAWVLGSLVHLDLKPANLRLTPQGRLKVLDFGVARVLTRTDRPGGVQFGSLATMAPERLLRGEESPAADVYALGCVLLELVGGRRLGPSPIDADRHGRAVDKALTRADRELEARGLHAEPRRRVLELTGAMLRAAPEARPPMDAVHASLLAFSRSSSGPDLAAWVARVLPGVVDEGVDVTGTLVRGEVVDVRPADLEPAREEDFAEDTAPRVPRRLAPAPVRQAAEVQEGARVVGGTLDVAEGPSEVSHTNLDVEPSPFPSAFHPTAHVAAGSPRLASVVDQRAPLGPSAPPMWLRLGLAGLGLTLAVAAVVAALTR